MFGLERGFCLMIGGEDDIVAHLDPLFADHRPRASTPPRARRAGPASRAAEQGYLHCGPAGAGHFVKMVHNGIEYGIMAAYAEGMNVLAHADVGPSRPRGQRRDDAAARPEHYQYDDRHPRGGRGLAPRQRRRVVASRPRRRTRCPCRRRSTSSGAASPTPGEGRWTLLAAIDEGVPTHVLSAALFDRFESRGEADFANRLLSAMRKEFGGHDEQKPS